MVIASRLLCLLSIATLTACSDAKVKQPSSDSTPPLLVWNAYNFDTSVQADYPGSPTINAKRGERYRITLKANDPEGVKQIQLNPTAGSGEISWQCVTPPGGVKLAQNKSAALGPMTQNLAPDASGYVLTSIFLIQQLDLAMDCQPGWSFASGTAALTGVASNYFGGVTTEILSFNVSP
jgi:hypothetical protein